MNCRASATLWIRSSCLITAMEHGPLQAGNSDAGQGHGAGRSRGARRSGT
ncbi:hypothetical protein CLM86_14040, partial [Pseudomonas aeruginosa]